MCVVPDVSKGRAFEPSVTAHPTTQSYISKNWNPHRQNLKSALFFFCPFPFLSLCACISICQSLCSHPHFHFLSVPHSFLPRLVAVGTLFRPTELYLLSVSCLLSQILELLQTHTHGVGVRACPDFSKRFVPRGPNPVVSTCAFYSWLRSHAHFAFRYCCVLVYKQVVT